MAVIDYYDVASVVLKSFGLRLYEPHPATPPNEKNYSLSSCKFNKVFKVCQVFLTVLRIFAKVTDISYESQKYNK